MGMTDLAIPIGWQVINNIIEETKTAPPMNPAVASRFNIHDPFTFIGPPQSEEKEYDEEFPMMSWNTSGVINYNEMKEDERPSIVGPCVVSGMDSWINRSPSFNMDLMEAFSERFKIVTFEMRSIENDLRWHKMNIREWFSQELQLYEQHVKECEIVGTRPYYYIPFVPEPEEHEHVEQLITYEIVETLARILRPSWLIKIIHEYYNENTQLMSYGFARYTKSLLNDFLGTCRALAWNKSMASRIYHWCPTYKVYCNLYLLGSYDDFYGIHLVCGCFEFFTFCISRSNGEIDGIYKRHIAMVDSLILEPWFKRDV